MDTMLCGDYNPNWTLTEAKKRVLSILKDVMPEALCAANVELATIVGDGSSGRFSYVGDVELRGLITEVVQQTGGD